VNVVSLEPNVAIEEGPLPFVDVNHLQSTLFLSLIVVLKVPWAGTLIEYHAVFSYHSTSLSVALHLRAEDEL
jgi:hypothetical protein